MTNKLDLIFVGKNINYYGYMPHRMASLTEWPNL